MFTNRGFILQYAKFAVVGITSLMVDYGVLVFLTENTAFGLDYFQAGAFSYTISIFVNYILSMKYVFQSREDMSKMKEAGIRVQVDDRNEKIGYKIREAQMEKVPYMLVVGANEAEAGQVAVRRRDKGDMGAIAADEFIAMVKADIADKIVF